MHNDVRNTAAPKASSDLHRFAAARMEPIGNPALGRLFVVCRVSEQQLDRAQLACAPVEQHARLCVIMSLLLKGRTAVVA